MHIECIICLASIADGKLAQIVLDRNASKLKLIIHHDFLLFFHFEYVFQVLDSISHRITAWIFQGKDSFFALNSPCLYIYVVEKTI